MYGGDCEDLSLYPRDVFDSDVNLLAGDAVKTLAEKHQGFQVVVTPSQDLVSTLSWTNITRYAELGQRVKNSWHIHRLGDGRTCAICGSLSDATVFALSHWWTTLICLKFRCHNAERTNVHKLLDYHLYSG